MPANPGKWDKSRRGSRANSTAGHLSERFPDRYGRYMSEIVDPGFQTWVGWQGWRLRPTVVGGTGVVASRRAWFALDACA